MAIFANGVANWANNLILLSGWRAAIMAILLGAISAMGLAPFHFFPVLWISFPLFICLLDGAVPDGKKNGLYRLAPAFARGYWFGFGYFIAGLWWMGSAFLVNADRFAWLMPLAIIGLPLFLATFFGLATAFSRLFWGQGFGRVVILAACLAFFEWLRASILTGFPWNSLGHLLAFNDVMMQGISIFGLPLYNFFAVLIFSCPIYFLDRERNAIFQHLFFICVISLAIGLFSFGFLRIADNETEYVTGPKLRIIQPNIAQKDKFKPEKAGEILQRYLELSARKEHPKDLALLETTHLIWPESAFPFLLTEQPRALAAIAALLPPGTTLLTGAVRADPKQANQKDRNYYNSLYVINDNGEIKDAYDKVHLVPFGEYLPFQGTLESLGLLSLVEFPGGFKAGTQRRLVQTSSAPSFLPLICYEVIFSGQLNAGSGIDKAGWILNITNDAWFGLTSGPYQHFHQTRLRAVEEGVPVIRAANNGISAVIDSYGRVLEKISLDKSGILTSQIPLKVVLWIGAYERNFMFWLILSIVFLIFLPRIWSKNQYAY